MNFYKEIEQFESKTNEEKMKILYEIREACYNNIIYLNQEIYLLRILLREEQNK